MRLRHPLVFAVLWIALAGAAPGRCELVELVERAHRLREDLLVRLRYERLPAGTLVGHGRGESLQCAPVDEGGHYRLRSMAALEPMLRSLDDFGRLMARILDALRQELRAGAKGLRLETGRALAPVSDGRWTRPGRVAVVRLDGGGWSTGEARLLFERMGALLSFHATLGHGLLVEASLGARLRILMDERRWVALRRLPVSYSGVDLDVEGLRLREDGDREDP